MNNNTVTVKFKKKFVQGTLKGLEYDTSLDFPGIESAIWYTEFLNLHKEKPVYSLDSSYYTCHDVEILRD